MNIVERLDRASAQVNLDTADMARALDTSPRTVTRWLNYQTVPRRQHRERILETVVVLDHLHSAIAHGAASDWLLTPVPLLDYEKPIDLLRQGEYRRVLRAIDAIGEGVFL